MTSIIGGSTVTVFKAVHSDSFSSESLKVKMFIIQVDNKITDAAEIIEDQKIRYAILLLWESALEWMATFMNNEEEITFNIYLQFKIRFLWRFINSNSVESIIKKLMNLRQEKTLILKYCTKIMNLAELANLENQTAKIHFFWGLHFRDQD